MSFEAGGELQWQIKLYNDAPSFLSHSVTGYIYKDATNLAETCMIGHNFCLTRRLADRLLGSLI